MAYCVNCGIKYSDSPSICRNCYSDPVVTWSQIDRALSGFQRSADGDTEDPGFTYPKEHLSLIIAIIIFITVGFALSFITLSIFFWSAVISILFLKVQLRTLRSSNILVTGKTFPMYYNLARVAAYRLKMPLPPVFIQRSPDFNAYATGFWGDYATVFYSALVESLDGEELLSVIGHEFGHVKCEHATWLSIVNPPYTTMLGTFFNTVIRIIFNNWSLRSEYTADRAGLTAVRNLRKAVSAQLKIAVGARLFEEMDVDSALDQFETAGNKEITTAAEYLFATHPMPANRIKQLIQFHRSPLYEAIVSNKPLRGV